MRPTRIRLLIGLAVLSAAIGWALGTIVTGQTGRVLPIPVIAPLTIWVLVVALLLWTLLSRPRLQRRPGVRPLHPIVAARTAALAMATSRTGAVVGGLYAGVLAATVPQFATQRGTETVWVAVIIVVGCFVLTVIAVWLERMCQVPNHEPPQDAIGFHGA